MTNKLNLIICGWIVLFVSISLLAGCSRSEHVEDLKQYMAEMKQSVANRQKKIPPAEFRIPVSKKYTSTGLRSPFDESGFAASGNTNAANPLLAYPLTVLRFVGTLSQGSKTYAFILAPDNMVYQVKAGDVIGDRQGRIVDVYSDRINVMEKEANDQKTTAERMVTMQLKDAH